MTAKTNPPGVVALLWYRPPILALVLLGLAGLLALAPEPTSPTATGISPRVFALPLLVAALAAAGPALLRVLSQRRALRAGQPMVCKVTAVHDLTSTQGRPRFRILWAEQSGRTGQSPVIKGWWTPPVGAKITVLQDPVKGLGWWEGSLPSAPVAVAQPAKATPRLSALTSTVGFWIAVFAFGAALVLALDGAPSAFAIVGLVVGMFGAISASAMFRSQKRAFGQGRRIQATVKAHRGSGVGPGTQSFAMEWRTSAGHFGETDFVSGVRLVPVGKSITVAIDPLTHRGWWLGP